VGAQAGWATSTALGIAMLAAAVITGFAAPWRLTCLRCRAVVTVRDAVCPSCGQAFLD
jgi:rRNA maturation endonuclease Nob1